MTSRRKRAFGSRDLKGHDLPPARLTARFTVVRYNRQRGADRMAPRFGGKGWEGVSAATVNEAVDPWSVPCPPQEKAFLRPFVAGQKDVVARGRDPGVLISAVKSASPCGGETPRFREKSQPPDGRISWRYSLTGQRS